jgi:hypothetical protein
MADPECGVVLYLCDQGARPTAPVAGFHIEFLVFPEIGQKKKRLNFKLPGRRIIVLKSFL